MLVVLVLVQVLVLVLLVQELVLFRLSVLMVSFHCGRLVLVHARDPHRWHGDGSQHPPTPCSLNLARSHGLIQRSSHDMYGMCCNCAPFCECVCCTACTVP